MESRLTTPSGNEGFSASVLPFSPDFLKKMVENRESDQLKTILDILKRQPEGTRVHSEYNRLIFLLLKKALFWGVQDIAEHLVIEGACLRPPALDINEQNVLHKLVKFVGRLPAPDGGSTNFIDFVSLVEAAVKVCDIHYLMTKDIQGKTPLHYSVMSGNHKITQELLNLMKSQKSEMNLLDLSSSRWIDYSGCTPIMHAIKNRDSLLLKLLIDCGGIRNLDTVMEHSVALPILLPNYYSAPLDHKNEFSFHIPGTEHSYTPLMMATELADSDSVRLLRLKGTDPNYQDENGETPLHFAVRSNSVTCIQEILEPGGPDGSNSGGLIKRINTEIKEKNNGWTPLLLACI